MIDLANGQATPQAAAPEDRFQAPRYGLRGGFFSCAGVFIVIGLLGFCSFRLELMMSTRTVHPPAGSNPVIVFFTAPQWRF
jgi:hypothetical protein